MLELFGSELGIGGLVALPVGLGADDRCVIVPSSFRSTYGRLRSGKGAGLDIGGHADAADLAVGFGLRAARLSKSFQSARSMHCFHVAGEFARIIHAANGVV